jgi:hypothetical protein
MRRRTTWGDHDNTIVCRPGPEPIVFGAVRTPTPAATVSWWADVSDAGFAAASRDRQCALRHSRYGDRTPAEMAYAPIRFD